MLVSKSMVGGGSAKRRNASHATCLALALLAFACLLLTFAGAAGATVITHVSYGPRMRQYLDIYPSRTPNAPVVVLVHGGGWRVFDDLQRFERESEALQKQGITVFTINYDQDSPTKPAFPTEPNDVELAIQWAIENAARFDGNPNDVVLVGGSAGGQLVDVAGEQMDAASPGSIRGVVSLSGPSDFLTLVPLIQEGIVENENFITSVYQAVGREENGTPYMFATQAGEEAYERTWSPADNPIANCPKWLLFNSQDELIPLSQEQEMYERLEASGCPATMDVVPGTKHAFAYWNSVSETVASFVKSA